MLVDILTTSCSLCTLTNIYYNIQLTIYIPTCSLIMKPFNISKPSPSCYYKPLPFPYYKPLPSCYYKPLPSCYYTCGSGPDYGIASFPVATYYLPSHYYEPPPLTYITVPTHEYGTYALLLDTLTEYTS